LDKGEGAGQLYAPFDHIPNEWCRLIPLVLWCSA
jgi:hypothetical protein